MTMQHKRKIIFRADAAPEIGYGHFVRTLALADMLKDDFDCTFYTQTPTESQKNQAATVCPLKELPSDDSKFPLFLSMLSGDECVVLDNYFYTTEYQGKIRAKGCKLVCIDDIHDKHYVSDVLINHAVTDKSLFSVEPYTRLCLGTEWALLRKPFLTQGLHKTISNRNNLTVCTIFGGADYFDLTDKAVAALSEIPEVAKIKAVVGFNSPLPKSESPKVEYLQNLSAEQMAELYGSCDIALVPASTVCIEALACGIPVVAGYFVDNQRAIYADYCDRGYISGLGNLLEGFGASKLRVALKQCTSEANSTGIPQKAASAPDNYRRLFASL